MSHAGTCATYGSVDAVINSVTEIQTAGPASPTYSLFSCAPAPCFPALQSTLSKNNNIPISFNGYSGNLPPGLAEGQPYYMRIYAGTSFAIAGQQDGPLLNGIGPFAGGFPATTSSFSNCPVQGGSPFNPSNFNRDGTIKIPR